MANSDRPHAAPDWGVTRQGWYIATPDGNSVRVFGREDWQPQYVQRAMDMALAYYQRVPNQHAVAENEAPTWRDGLQADPTTSVIEVFERIPNLKVTCPEDYDGLNLLPQRDLLWIYADEVRAIAEASDHKTEDFPLPRALVGRLVRFCLIDMMNTRVSHFQGRGEVKKAEFFAHCTTHVGSHYTCIFTGQFAASRSPHLIPSQHINEGTEAVGRTGTIAGEFELDSATAKIIRFRAYSEGMAWGGPQGRPLSAHPGYDGG